MRSDKALDHTLLMRFVRLPPADQRAIAQHLDRNDQRRLADWLDKSAPRARREKSRALKLRLRENGSAVRRQTLRAISQGKLTAATQSALEAHLARREVRPAFSEAEAGAWLKQGSS